MDVQYFFLFHWVIELTCSSVLFSRKYVVYAASVSSSSGVPGWTASTNEESFILASHVELLPPCDNRYLNDGLIQGPPDELSGGYVAHAEHPIFYDIEHCLKERYEAGRGVVRNDGRRSRMQGA